MIIRIDFITGKWVFLGCENHSEDSKTINEVINRATALGCDIPTERRVANRMIEMWIQEQAKHINTTDTIQSQEGEDR